MLRHLVVLISVLMVLVSVAVAQDDGESRTTVHDRAAARKLLGEHKISLQWISWDYYGSATVSQKRCRGLQTEKILSGQCYWLNGEQKGRTNSDYLKIGGMIMSIDATHLTFEGTIQTQVSHINKGKPCVRSGNFTFKITGKRKYWRLVEMENPCDQATDYIDLYFR